MNTIKWNYKILMLLLVINITVMMYFMHRNWGKEINDSKNLHKILTILIYDFENFENGVVGTVKAIHTISPQININIVSDELPYPPLDITSPEAKINLLKIKPDQASRNSRPEEFIKTKYTLFVPDGFLLRSIQSLTRMVRQLEEHKLHMIVAGVDGGVGSRAECEKLQFDMRKWTLVYSSDRKSKIKDGLQICDAVKGDVAVLMKTDNLRRLAYAFIRPHLEALFMQSALRKWKTGLVIGHNSPFAERTELFASGHNKWKHERNRNNQRKELFKRFGIKKVTDQDGSIEWFGCSKDTARCFGTIHNDVPSFIYDGRWTPPCCLENLRTTARHVFKIFDDNNIPYWLEGGSLLGAVRHEDIIPWDYDVDIGMYREDIDKLLQLKQAKDGKKVVDNKGFVWEKSREGDFFRVQFSAVNHLHVDIFPFYEKNGIMTKDTWFETHRQDTEFPVHYLKPLERIKFVGMSVSVPNNHKEFLEFKFGKGVIENPKYPNAKFVKTR